MLVADTHAVRQIVPPLGISFLEQKQPYGTQIKIMLLVIKNDLLTCLSLNICIRFITFCSKFILHGKLKSKCFTVEPRLSEL